MRGTGSSPGDKGGGRSVLVRYRVVGGPVSVDQRLTVFEDGAVRLDERHRSRDPTWLQVDAPELDRLRAALEEIPASRWSILPGIALTKARRVFIPPLSRDPVSDTRFQLKQGRHVIAGETGEDPDLAAALALLDALRMRAVRLHPR